MELQEFETQNLSNELKKSLKEISDYKYALDESCIVAITDHTGIIKYVNQNFCKISKYTSEELIGKDHRIINSGYHTKEFIRDIWKTIANGKIWKGELKNKAKDGTHYWVDTTLIPFLNEQGKPYQYVAIRSDITERKKGEEKLNESIKEISDYKNALDLSSIVAITDQKGIIKHVNENFCKISKYSKEELIGKDHRIINSGNHPKEFIRNLWVTIASGKVWRGELKNKAKDGSYYWVDTTIIPFLNEDGKPFQYVAIRSDITERKKVEQELASQYARNLIEASLDPLVTISPAGKITDVNEASIKATGIQREKLIDTDFSDYFTEPEKAREGYKLVFEKGFVSDYPLTIRHKNGQLTPVLYNASVYKDDKGNVLGVFAAARDITKQKQAEEKIKKIQIYTRTLIETSLDPQITKGSDGLITDVNEATVQVTGIPREKIIGTHFPNYFTEPQKAEEAYQEAFEKGVVRNRMLAIKHISGKITDVLYNATVYKDEHGRVQGVFASARDITDRKKAEEKIKKLNEELEQRIIELESFSYSVSHDLRAPLRGVDGFIAMFLSKYLDKVDDEGQRLLGNVRRNVTKMGNLIDELLTLSRIGMKDIQISTIDMNELVETVLEELSEIKGKAKVNIKNLNDAKGDIALIKQVLVNLLSNAFKYSNKKELPVIEIGSHSNGEEEIFYVKDNGVGFDMEYSNKLFGVFQRLHDPQEYAGTGVGLAIVKRIITRHGGKVWAEGKENEGAVFNFSLKK